MTSFKADRALVLIDFINEIVDLNGKFAGKGYAEFDARHGVLDRAGKLLQNARSSGFAIIHVGLGFSADYKEQPETSPLFGSAKKFGALKIGDWGTKIHPKVAPVSGEAVLTKHRVSAFFGTTLDIILRNYGVREIFVLGCATDMAVQSAAHDAHDRDYVCTIVGDCCIAANDEDHEQTLRLLGKIAKVINLNQFTRQSLTQMS